MKRPALVVALLALLSLAAAPAGASLITNGSFETASLNPGTFTTLGNGSTVIDGWTIIGSVDYIGSYWQASDGSRSLDLAGNFAGGITLASTFATTIGQDYVLTFDMAGNPDSGPTDKRLLVSAGGVTDRLFTFATTGHSRTDMGWQSFSLVFAATSTATTLTFKSGLDGSNPYGPALDNVAVSAVPEPSSLLLLGAGLLGLATTARRRSRR